MTEIGYKIGTILNNLKFARNIISNKLNPI